MLTTTIWLGAIGFIDDYIKVFKKEKKGLAGKFKVMGQVGLGIIVGATVYFHPEIKTKVEIPSYLVEEVDSESVLLIEDQEGNTHYMLDRKLPNTSCSSASNSTCIAYKPAKLSLFSNAIVISAS